MTECQLTLVTRPLPEGRPPNGSIQMTYDIDKLYESNTSFYYVADPVVESVDKMESFIR